LFHLIPNFPAITREVFTLKTEISERASKSKTYNKVKIAIVRKAEYWLCSK